MHHSLDRAHNSDQQVLFILLNFGPCKEAYEAGMTFRTQSHGTGIKIFYPRFLVNAFGIIGDFYKSFYQVFPMLIYSPMTWHDKSQKAFIPYIYILIKDGKWVNLDGFEVGIIGWDI